LFYSEQSSGCKSIVPNIEPITPIVGAQKIAPSAYFEHKPQSIEANVKRIYDMNYSQQMLAQVEYDRMVKSVPPVYEYPRDVVVSSPAADWLRAILMSVLHLVIR
jgi:hypothetical protein